MFITQYCLINQCLINWFSNLYYRPTASLCVKQPDSWLGKMHKHVIYLSRSFHSLCTLDMSAYFLWPPNIVSYNSIYIYIVVNLVCATPTSHLINKGVEKSTRYPTLANVWMQMKTFSIRLTRLACTSQQLISLSRLTWTPYGNVKRSEGYTMQVSRVNQLWQTDKNNLYADLWANVVT